MNRFNRTQEVTMVDSGVAKKLRIEPEQKVLALNTPHGYVDDLSS